MQQFWFDRFLCRVFTYDSEAAWTLKGGVSLLARVNEARSTQDIDFTVDAEDVSSVIDELVGIAARDLGDHVTFEARRQPTVILGQGEHVTGRRVSFVGRCGGHEVARFHVDVVVAPAPVGKVVSLPPQNRATLNKPLPTTNYRLFPVEDHLAEKMAAKLAHVRGDENTRVKDLVDIVIMSRTQEFDLGKLREALAVAFLRANATIPQRVKVPSRWRASFAGSAAGTMIAGMSFDDALSEAQIFLGPVLTSTDSAALEPSQSLHDVAARE